MHSQKQTRSAAGAYVSVFPAGIRENLRASVPRSVSGTTADIPNTGSEVTWPRQAQYMLACMQVLHAGLFCAAHCMQFLYAVICMQLSMCL